MSRTVLVTGGSGALGSQLVPLLRDRGWTTRALVHRRPVPDADEQVKGSVVDAASVRAAVDGVDAAVHLAARTHARRASAYEFNVRSTQTLVDAVEAAGVGRLVHVSTRAISPAGGPYSSSKARAEEVVARSTLDYVIVRLPDIVGLGEGEGIAAIVASARRGAPVLLVGGGASEICPIGVGDALGALSEALDRPEAARKTYTLAGTCTSLRAFAEQIVERLDSRSRIIPVPIALVTSASFAARFIPLPLYPDQLARLRAPKPPRSADAETDLGFRPRALAQLLDELSRA